MNYRPHIDGLRAIAILFVLIFHSGLSLFPSGFIGVDVFFVISGFLITSIIHKALQSQHFSFFDFYNRRLWRLQPVFVCLILVTTILTFIFYLPSDLLTFGKSARKTSIFLSNVYFERITFGYFAENINHLPLLHTWSLSIEWQCYLVLPIFIYLLHRLIPEKYLALITYLLTLAFFALALHYSFAEPSKTYFLFFSRIFEFLIGSSVALTSKRFTFNKLFLNLISLAALCSLLYFARLQGINLGFPNSYTFVLCLATAILIFAGEQEKNLFCIKLLSLKPIVFIGLLSYSLYIWHWPVFVLIRYLDIEQTRLILIFVFALIGLISYLSWRFIEIPSRKRSQTKFVYSLALLFILPAILFHLNAYGIKKFQGYPQRLPEDQRINAMLEKYSSSLRAHCLDNFVKKKITVNPNCLLGAQTPTSRRGFMIGDSFANHNWQFMDLLAKQANISVLAPSVAGCLSLPGVLQYKWMPQFRGVYERCRDLNALYYKMIKENHYDFVIIGQDWYSYLNDAIINKVGDKRSIELAIERVSKAIEEALQRIIESGATPVILKSVAKPNANLHDCYFKYIKRRMIYQPGLCNFQLDPTQGEWFDTFFAAMQKKYSQLILIDPRQVQCPDGLCKADINGFPVYRDVVHLTDYASYQLARSYLKQTKNPLLVS